MTDVAKNAEAERPSFVFLLGVSVAGGVSIGVFDLWWVEMSARAFLAGIAAGVCFMFVVAMTVYLIGRPSRIVLNAMWCIGGVIGGVTWWLVARPQAPGPFGSALLGLLLACVPLVSEGLLSEKRSTNGRVDR
ncbi:MAG: hypothetical protein ACRD1P_01920 [Thermoanaerobaculia bacterium]